MNAIQSVIEGITTYLSEQAKRGIAEDFVCNNLRVDVDMMGQPIKIRLDGSIARIVKASSDEQQAPAPADAPAWDEEPLLDMGQGQVTVMCRWLQYKKQLRERPDVALLFLAHIDATATVSWPTIRPPATGGASSVPFALCCWYLEQVDKANDGRLEAAQAWIDERLFPKRRGRAPGQAEAPERQDGTRRDAEGDNPSAPRGDRAAFGDYLTRLLKGQSIRSVARSAGILAQLLMKWEKGDMPDASDKAALRKLAKFYGVAEEEMLRAAGLE